MNKPLFLLLFISVPLYAQWLLPVNCADRSDVSGIQLTNIGHFGALRKARPTIPAHYHTGIDIIRPRQNYDNEPVLAAREGIVVSLIDDGPYSQIILRHEYDNKTFWSVYEHIRINAINIGQSVTVTDTIGYFFNKDELNTYGWQFDHLHFEIIKCSLPPLKPTEKYPNRFYSTFAVSCYTQEELHARMENPFNLFNENASLELKTLKNR